MKSNRNLKTNGYPIDPATEEQKDLINELNAWVGKPINVEELSREEAEELIMMLRKKTGLS